MRPGRTIVARSPKIVCTSRSQRSVEAADVLGRGIGKRADLRGLVGAGDGVVGVDRDRRDEEVLATRVPQQFGRRLRDPRDVAGVVDHRVPAGAFGDGPLDRGETIARVRIAIALQAHHRLEVLLEHPHRRAAAVEDRDLPAAILRLIDLVGTEESGAAEDEDLHVVAPTRLENEGGGGTLPAGRVADAGRRMLESFGSSSVSPERRVIPTILALSICPSPPTPDARTASEPIEISPAAALADPDRLRAWHDLLASEPQVAGTEGDHRSIEVIDAAFEAMGLDSEPWWFRPLLAYPVSASLEIVDLEEKSDGEAESSTPTANGTCPRIPRPRIRP